MTRSVVLLFAVLCVLGIAAAASADPVVPGGLVETDFAAVGRPQTLTFDSGSYMYVGNGNGHSPIYRVSLADGSYASYGLSTTDPDAVQYNAMGVIGGVPGSVLVGGVEGELWAIRPPDETTVLLFPHPSFSNPTDMAFDSAGRLLFVDCDIDGVFETTGENPALLCSMIDPINIAVGPDDRIYVGSSDRTIRVYASDGTLLDDAFDAFTKMDGCMPLAFGPGGVWGTDLYAIGDDTLWRYSGESRTAIGTGFSSNYVDMGFGPDGKLYISDYTNNSIIRVTVPEPAAVALLMLGAVALARRRRAA